MCGLALELMMPITALLTGVYQSAPRTPCGAAKRER